MRESHKRAQWATREQKERFSPSVTSSEPARSRFLSTRAELRLFSSLTSKLVTHQDVAGPWFFYYILLILY